MSPTDGLMAHETGPRGVIREANSDPDYTTRLEDTLAALLALRRA